MNKWFSETVQEQRATKTCINNEADVFFSMAALAKHPQILLEQRSSNALEEARSFGSREQTGLAHFPFPKHTFLVYRTLVPEASKNRRPRHRKVNCMEIHRCNCDG